MREFVNSKMWLRRGTSVVFDKAMLGPLLQENALVPLREALAWIDCWPVRLPVGGRTILVGGLDTILEVLPQSEAEQFARTRIRRLIAEFQDRWTEVCSGVWP